MALEPKIRRCEKRLPEDDKQSTSSLMPENILMDLLSALGRICLADINVVKLVPLKIVNSNAAHMNGGIPFSKAFCELEIGEKRFSFGDVFRRGIDLCLDYIEGKLPDKKNDRIVLDRLVQFLTSGNYVVHSAKKDMVESQGLAPARKKNIDPSTYNYTREDTMADPSSLRPPFFTLFSLNSSTHRHRSFD